MVPSLGYLREPHVYYIARVIAVKTTSEYRKCNRLLYILFLLPETKHLAELVLTYRPACHATLQ